MNINKIKLMRKWYAGKRPRGFLNEVKIFAFTSKQKRDIWVRQNYGDGGQTSAFHLSKKELLEMYRQGFITNMDKDAEGNFYIY